MPKPKAIHLVFFNLESGDSNNLLGFETLQSPSQSGRVDLVRELVLLGREMGSLCTTYWIPSKQSCSLVRILIDTGMAPTVCC